MSIVDNVLDLCIRQGQDERILLTIRDDAAELMNLTGATFLAQAKDSYLGSAVFSFSFSIKNQTTNTGEVEMILLGSTSSRIKVNHPTNYLYDVKMTLGGEPIRIIQGNILFSPEVSK